MTYNRFEVPERLAHYKIYVGDNFSDIWVNGSLYECTSNFQSDSQMVKCQKNGRFVVIILWATQYLSLCEVRIFPVCQTYHTIYTGGFPTDTFSYQYSVASSLATITRFTIHWLFYHSEYIDQQIRKGLWITQLDLYSLF